LGTAASAGALRSGVLKAADAVAEIPWPAAWATLLLLLPSLGRQLASPVGDLSVPFAVRAAAILPLVATVRRRWAQTAGWIAIAALAVLAGAAVERDRLERPPAIAPDPWTPSGWNRASGRAILRLTARPRPEAAGTWTAPAVLLRWNLDAPGAGLAPGAGDGVLLRASGTVPALGAVLGGPLQLQPPRWAVTRGGFDEAGWLAGRDIVWVGRVAPGDTLARARLAGVAPRVGALQARLQDALRARLSGGLPAPEADIAAAVLLGGGASRPLREGFTRLGLAHLFALSGLHVGIVSGLVLVLLRPLARTPARQLPLLAPLLAGYAVLVDVPGSVVRAVGLVVVSLGLRAAGRDVDSLRLLGLLLWANLLWQPAAVTDAGLRLSYLAAGGSGVGQRLVRPVIAAWSRPARWLASGGAVSGSAQVATLPVVAESFGVLPLAGPLLNLVAVPWFGLVAFVLAGGLLVILACAWAGEGLLACAWLLLRPMLAVTTVASPALAAGEFGLPVWGPGRLIAGLTAVVGLVAAWRLPGRWRWACVPLAYGALLLVAGTTKLPGAGGAVAAWQFGVGQGDCALVRLPDGWTCLIDTGEAWAGGGSAAGRDVLPMLRRLGIRRLDVVCLTHGHDDHTGGAPDVGAAWPVGRWLIGGSARAPATTSAIATLVPGAVDTLHAAGAWALVAYAPPDDPAAAAAENDRSLALALCQGGVLRGLWTGDLETAGEATLVGRLPPVPAAGLPGWKAGHHGSRTSGSPALLAALRPRLVLVSCGVANRHRHPSHGPYGDAEVVRTDLQGTVALAWDGLGTLRADPCQPAPRW